MKKLISLLITLAMLAGMFSMFAVYAAADGASGAITPDTSWYDGDTANATNSEFVLKDAADLLGFAQILYENGTSKRPFSGDTIKLDADIDLNPGWDASTGVAPANVWPAVKTYFCGTFDGQGHTVKGIYQQSSDAGFGGIFGSTWGRTVEVKNVTFLNSYSESTQTQGHGFLFGAMTNASVTTIDNVYVDAYVVNKATSAGDYGVGGLIGGYQSNDANVGIVLTNSVFAGKIVLDSDFVGRFYVGGLVGRYNSKSSNTIEDCAFYGDIKVKAGVGATIMASKICAYHSCAGTNLTVKNCIAGGNIALSEGTYAPAENGAATGNIFAEIIAAARYNNALSTVVFDNVLYTGNYTLLGCGYEQGKAIHTADPAEGDIKYYTGSFNADHTPVTVAITVAAITGTGASATLTANKLTNWVAVDGALVIPKTLVEGPAEEAPEEDVPLEITVPDNADISWYKSTQTEFVLEDAADLLGYGYIITAYEKIFSGKTIKLGADIDLNPGWDASTGTAPTVIWPVSGGDAKTKVAGTFDGQGHTIKGLYSNATIERAGLMGVVPEGVYFAIKNLNVVNSYIESNQDGVGGLLGCTYSSNTTIISNVYCDVDVVCTATKGNLLGVGGIIGGASWSKSSTYNLTVENTVYAGDIKVSFTESAYASDGTPGANVGGIVGFNNTLSIDDKGNNTMTIKDTAFYGTITGVMPKDGNIGGIFGMMKSNGVNILGCITAGKIDVEGITLGFIGDVYGDIGPAATAKVEKSLFTGTIGAGGFFDPGEGAIISVGVADIKGAAADAILTANGLTAWSSTADAYPLPTALKTQIGSIVVPTHEPKVEEQEPEDTTGGNTEDTTGDTQENTDNNTEAPTGSTTDAPATGDDKKGCGGSIIGGMAVVLMTATAAVAVSSKKKKD